MIRSGLTASISFCLLAQLAAADPIIDKKDRTEVNWTTMTMKFYGEAPPPANKAPVDFKKAELAAKQDGTQYYAKAVEELRGIDPTAPSAESATPSDSTTEPTSQAAGLPKSRSLNTVYFPSGRVRVEMEAPLSELMKPAGLRFAEQQMAKIDEKKTTGLVIKLANEAKPVVSFKVVDEGGAVLYDASQVAEEAYAKTSMGRWVKRPNKWELASIAGNNYKTVDGTWNGGDAVVVSKEKWDEALADGSAPLRNGAVAVVLP